jgi:hypothetical protein
MHAPCAAGPRVSTAPRALCAFRDELRHVLHIPLSLSGAP